MTAIMKWSNWVRNQFRFDNNLNSPKNKEENKKIVNLGSFQIIVKRIDDSNAYASESANFGINFEVRIAVSLWILWL